MPGKKRILITGGFGNLGSWITSHFVEKGFDVTVLSKSKKDFLKLNYNVLSVDISNLRECEEALGYSDFEYVIHAASINDVFVSDYASKALIINAGGTRNILQAIRKDSLKNFIYLSTYHVYGVEKGLVDESTVPSPKSDYAITHLFGEQYVKQFHLNQSLPFTIIRLTNSYGCPLNRDSSKWYLILNDLAKMCYERKMIELKSNGNATRDFIWMGDVCDALEKIVNSKVAMNSIFNLGSGVSNRLIEVAQKVQEAYSDLYGETLPIQVNHFDKSSHQNSLQVDISKLKELIEFTPENRMIDEVKKIFTVLEGVNS